MSGVFDIIKVRRAALRERDQVLHALRGEVALLRRALQLGLPHALALAAQAQAQAQPGAPPGGHPAGAPPGGQSVSAPATPRVAPQGAGYHDGPRQSVPAPSSRSGFMQQPAEAASGAAVAQTSVAVGGGGHPGGNSAGIAGWSGGPGAPVTAAHAAVQRAAAALPGHRPAAQTLPFTDTSSSGAGPPGACVVSCVTVPAEQLLGRLLSLPALAPAAAPLAGPAAAGALPGSAPNPEPGCPLRLRASQRPPHSAAAAAARLGASAGVWAGGGQGLETLGWGAMGRRTLTRPPLSAVLPGVQPRQSAQHMIAQAGSGSALMLPAAASSQEAQAPELISMPSTSPALLSSAYEALVPPLRGEVAVPPGGVSGSRFRVGSRLGA